MRYLILTKIIIVMLTLNLHSQTIFHKRAIISSGGGSSSDDMYTNLAVIGQTSYGESADNLFICGGGFLGGAENWITDIDEEEIVPFEFELSQNYPNPFNPDTRITYTLPERSHVTLEIFNILGQKTTTLVSEYQNAGRHTENWHAVDLSSGLYFYRIVAGEHAECRKMLLLK